MEGFFMYILYKFFEELNSRGGTVSGYMCFTPYFCLMIGICFFFLKSERQLICCVFSQSASCRLDIQFFMFFLWIISSSPKKDFILRIKESAFSLLFSCIFCDGTQFALDAERIRSDGRMSFIWPPSFGLVYRCCSTWLLDHEAVFFFRQAFSLFVGLH